MPVVFLVRHGVTAATGKRLGGHTDDPLDETGQVQAEGVAKRLEPLPLKAVYTSPLKRTRQTAEIVAAPHGLDAQTRDGVIEVDYGRWTDRPLKPLSRTKLWPIIQSRPSLVRFPDGEAIREAQLRAVGAVETLVGDHHRGDLVAVVSHADVIKALVAFYIGLPLDLFQRLQVGPCSVTVLRLGEGRPALLRFNDDGPLAADRFRRRRRG